MYLGVRVGLKYPVFLSDFNKTWIFSKDFQNIPIKTRAVGAEFSLQDKETDGRTDITKSLFAILRRRLKFQFVNVTADGMLKLLLEFKWRILLTGWISATFMLQIHEGKVWECSILEA
jgi:hypothetical protein